MSNQPPSPSIPGSSIPRCFGMQEIPTAQEEREKLANLSQSPLELSSSPIYIHLSHGLALTVGSALGSVPPTHEECFDAFLVPNKASLTAGARAWSKHAHRSLPTPSVDEPEEQTKRRKKNEKESAGWWGTPFGPVAAINEKALQLFWKVMEGATWRNLHWLPHQVLVYEVRVEEGYGMRWSQDQSQIQSSEDAPLDETTTTRPWIFRGFVEPMMENGHELGWRHPVQP